MADILVDADTLHRERRRAVRRLVAPILPQPPNAVVEQVGLVRNAYVIGVLPVGRSPTSYQNPEEILVATRSPKILMNYYETWRPRANSGEYSLDKAYMHIHSVFSSEAKQIFSLHCDPCLHPSERHFRYKRGPHVHIEGAVPDVSRGHISLCLAHKDLGGTDILSLTSSLAEAVNMIASELLPCWERA
jgi:hypothetical protein